MKKEMCVQMLFLSSNAFLSSEAPWVMILDRLYMEGLIPNEEGHIGDPSLKNSFRPLGTYEF